MSRYLAEFPSSPLSKSKICIPSKPSSEQLVTDVKLASSNLKDSRITAITGVQRKICRKPNFDTTQLLDGDFGA
jgi:hypothetical protein